MAAFVGRLALGWVAAWTLIGLVPAIQSFAITGTAATFAWMLGLVRHDVTLSGHNVTVAGASLDIISECTPLVPMLLLTGAVIAYPARAGARVIGLVAGNSALWAFNLVRLVVLVWILARAPRWFDLAHVFLWQTIGVLAAAAVFSVWVRWSMRAA